MNCCATLQKWGLKVIMVFGLLSGFQAFGASPEIAKIIQYTAPTNFFGGVDIESRSDPGDNPLSLQGPQILSFRERYDYRHPSDIIFNVGLACAYVGPGKVIQYVPATPQALKQDMETFYKDKFPASTPVLVSKIAGLTAVSFSASRPPGPIQPFFLHYCWIQIETNIVLKITAVSSDVTTFQHETNSLQTVKVDKVAFLRMLSSAQR
jgi:hypothetical protein